MTSLKLKSSTMSLESGSKRAGDEALGNARASQRLKTSGGYSVDPHQSVDHGIRRVAFRSTTFANPPSTTALQSPYTQFSQYFKPGTLVGNLHNAWLEFPITLDAAGVIAPITQWFDRIEVWTVGNPNMLAAYNKDDLMMSTFFTKYPFDHDRFAKRMGFEPASGGLPEVHQTAAITRNYYFPLELLTVLNAWEQGDVKDIGEIEFRFKPTSVGIVVSGSTAPTLGAIALTTTDKVLPFDREVKRTDSIDKNVHSHNFLLALKERKASQAYSAATQYDMPLDNWNHNSSFLVVAIRANPDTIRGIHRTASIGRNGTIDLIDAQGNSRLGSGVPVKGSLFHDQINKALFSEGFHSVPGFSDLHNFYVIPFSAYPRASFHGVVGTGSRTFDNTNWRLRINTDVALVPETHTINSASGSAGTYTLTYKGESTASLAHNSAASVIKTALDALPVAVKNELVFTVNGLATAASFTITIQKRAGDGTELTSWDSKGSIIQFVPGPAYTSGTVGATTVTASNEGFSADTYTIDVWSFYENVLPVARNKPTASLQKPGDKMCN